MRIKIAVLLTFLFTVTSVLSQEVGIQLYSLRNQFKKNVPSTLKLIRSWGIKKIEGGDNTYGLSEKKFIKLLDENGLDIVSLGTSYEELRDNPKRSLERAKKFGADYVMCAWISHDFGNFSFDDISKATEVFNKAGKILKEEGITLVYHAHGYEFKPYKQGTLFDYMVQNARNFDFEMDTYWIVHGGENPLKLLQKYPGRFKLMHLKDMRKGTESDGSGHSDVETNVVLGTGQIDMKAVIAEAKKQGIKYMFIEDESSRVVEQVPKSLVFINAQ